MSDAATRHWVVRVAQEYQHGYSAPAGHHADCRGDFAHDGPCKVESAAYTGDAERLRSLMDEWEATAEMGWSRPLSIEEARCVLSALSEGVAAMTTAEWERMRTVGRG